MEGEVTMICMDTSRWMRSNRSSRFKKQADAIELYITNILSFHSKNVVGVFGTGDEYIVCVIKPCRDLQRIMDTIYSVSIQGPLMLLQAIDYVHPVYLHDSTMPIRVAAFAGGDLCWYDDYELEFCGKKIKENNVALDVVIFGKRTKHKRFCLEWVVDAANNNNGNCRILDVPRGSTVCEAMSEFLSKTSAAPHKDMSPRVNQTKILLKSQRDALTREVEYLKSELKKPGKGETVQSSSTMEAEITVICMDTSMWMDMDRTKAKKKFRLRQQIELIERYVTERLKSHPHNLVGVCTSGGDLLVVPSGNLEHIMSCIKEGVSVYGTFDLMSMIGDANATLFFNKLGDMRERIALFVGGLIAWNPETHLRICATIIRKNKIAFDVVNFGDQSENKWELLETLVATASYNGNSRILHVPRDYKVTKVLSHFRHPREV